MQILLASLLLVAAGAQAQLTWPYGMPSPLLSGAHVMALKEPMVVKSLVPGIYPYHHVVQVAIPSQDTSRGLPQPVDDTPEVKSAKALFAKEYEKAAIAAALTPDVHKHPFYTGLVPEIHRRRRDLTSVMNMHTPMHIQMPVSTYMDPLTWMTGHQIMTPHYYHY